MPSIASCQKPEPEHCERRTKRKRNQQELDFERQEDNAHGYTSLESTMPVQFTEVGDKIGVDSDMDKIIDDDPSPIIEAGLTPLNSKCLILYVLIPFQETTVYLEDDENDLDKLISIAIDGIRDEAQDSEDEARDSEDEARDLENEAQDLEDEAENEERQAESSTELLSAKGTTTVDDSEEIPHRRSAYKQDKFAFMLSIWCEDVSISRSQYASLLEILKSLKDTRSIQILPASLDTLKSQFKAQIPVLPLRKKKIPVLSAKLPTLSAVQREIIQKPTTWLYWQDPVALLTRLTKSPSFRRSLYTGFGRFVDEPAELWESAAWLSSNRTTSGQFARYRCGNPILVSDGVYYLCSASDCPCKSDSTRHIGQVQAVGRDFRSASGGLGTICIMIYPYIKPEDASSRFRDSLMGKGAPFAPNEIIMHEKPIFLTEEDIIQQVTIYADKKFGSKFCDQLGNPSTKLFVRRVRTKSDLILPYCQVSPPRGLLEVEKYGRDYFLQLTDSNSLSLPYQLFIDGFGLYRNMYRNIMGTLFQPVSQLMNEQNRLTYIPFL